MVQTISMPVQVYSGIRPPQALLDATYSLPQPHVSLPSPATPSRPTPVFAPPPSDIPLEAPPSYEDAIADDLGPIDGPRREYSQPQQPQVPGNSLSSEKSTRQRLFP